MTRREVGLPAPTVVVDAPGRRLLPKVESSLPRTPFAVCVSNDPWLLAADVRAAVEDGSTHLMCVGGDESWLAAASGSSGIPGIVISHGGGGASLPRNFGLGSDVERNMERLAGDGVHLLPLDTIHVAPDLGAEVEAVNGIWTGFGRRAGLWARVTGSARAGLVVGGTSLRRDHLLLGMGTVAREVVASGLYVANGQFVDGLSLVPAAHPGDGKLDVLVFEGPARDIWRVLPRLATGTHLPHPRIRELHPVALRIEGRGRLFADGHDVGRLPALIEVRPARLRIAI